MQKIGEKPYQFEDDFFIAAIGDEEFCNRILEALKSNEGMNKEALRLFREKFATMAQTTQINSIISVINKKMKSRKKLNLSGILPVAVIIVVVFAVFVLPKMWENHEILENAFSNEEIVKYFEEIYGDNFNAEVIKSSSSKKLSKQENVITAMYDMTAQVNGKEINFQSRLSWYDIYGETNADLYYNFDSELMNVLFDEAFAGYNVDFTTVYGEKYTDSYKADYSPLYYDYFNLGLFTHDFEESKNKTTIEIGREYYRIDYNKDDITLEELEKCFAIFIEKLSSIDFADDRLLFYNFSFHQIDESRDERIGDLDISTAVFEIFWDDIADSYNKLNSSDYVKKEENVRAGDLIDYTRKMQTIEVEGVEFEIPADWSVDESMSSEQSYFFAPQGGAFINQCGIEIIIDEYTDSLYYEENVNKDNLYDILQFYSTNKLYDFKFKNCMNTKIGKTYRVSYYLQEDDTKYFYTCYYGLNEGQTFRVISFENADAYENAESVLNRMMKD